MRLTLTLAWRNLWRNRRRSVLTLVAVLFPVMLLNLMWGMSGAMQRNIFDNTALLQTGHIQIHVAGYEELKNTLPLITDVDPILSAIANEPAVSWSTVRLELPALVAHNNRSRGVMVQGVQPGDENVNPIDKWVTEGRSLQPDDRGTAIAGLALLEHLETPLGETMVLITAHPQTGTGVLVPEVVGVMDPPARELSRAVVQVPLADARGLVKNDKAATNVVLLIEGVGGPWDQQLIDEAAERLQATLGEGYVVETWDDLAPETVALFNIIGPLYLVFAMIFFVLAGLVVLNTLYLSVLERTRELGVILALGSSRRRVLGWIEVESVVLAGIGAVLGSALGAGLVALGGLGFDIPGIGEDIIKAVGISPTLYLRMTLGEGLLSAGMMFGIALLAAAYPGYKASRLEPVDAMRFAGN